MHNSLKGHSSSLNAEHSGQHWCSCGLTWAAEEETKVASVQENIKNYKLNMIKALRDYVSAIYGGRNDWPEGITLKQRADNAMELERELIEWGFELDDVRKYIQAKRDTWLASDPKYAQTNPPVGLKDAKDFVEAYALRWNVLLYKGPSEALVQSGRATALECLEWITQREKACSDFEARTYRVFKDGAINHAIEVKFL